MFVKYFVQKWQALTKTSLKDDHPQKTIENKGKSIRPLSETEKYSLSLFFYHGDECFGQKIGRPVYSGSIM